MLGPRGRRMSLHPLALALPWVNSERGGLSQAAQGVLLASGQAQKFEGTACGSSRMVPQCTLRVYGSCAPVADRKFPRARHQPPHRATMATTGPGLSPLDFWFWGVALADPRQTPPATIQGLRTTVERFAGSLDPDVERRGVTFVRGPKRVP